MSDICICSSLFWSLATHLELYEGELCLPGLMVDEVVVVLGRDVEGVTFLGVELGGVQDHRDLALEGVGIWN